MIKDKELDESRGLMDEIIKSFREKELSPGEAEEKFKELENLQGTQERKNLGKLLKTLQCCKEMKKLKKN